MCDLFCSDPAFYPRLRQHWLLPCPIGHGVLEESRAGVEEEEDLEALLRAADPDEVAQDGRLQVRDLPHVGRDQHVAEHVERVGGRLQFKIMESPNFND